MPSRSKSTYNPGNAEPLPGNESYPAPEGDHLVAQPEDKRHWAEWYLVRDKVLAEHRERLARANLADLDGKARKTS